MNSTLRVLIIFTLALPNFAIAAKVRCEQVLLKTSAPIGAVSASDLKGTQFLHQRNANLFKSFIVQKTAQMMSVRSREKNSQPNEKIAHWLKYMEKSYAEARSNPEALQKSKQSYLRNYVIKEAEIPESYFEMQVRIAREQGHGNIKLDSNSKKELARILIEDQTKSLSEWLDYFFSEDSKSYPMWIKYWAFTNMVKLAKFDPESGTFTNRGKDQVGPFPELNRESFSYVVDAIIKSVNGKTLEGIQDEVFLNLIKGANFGKLYGRAILLSRNTHHDLTITDGEWKRFPKGSPASDLVASLKGMNTGWCTAGESTAESQLARGDFYVYYSKDPLGNAKIPRIAIRMEDTKIAEVRGVAKKQNMDLHIAETNILDKKLEEFGSEADAYKKKTKDMKYLSEIEKNVRDGIGLTKENLKFLYEIDEKILGFGFQKDPRIKEILRHRDQREDLAKVLDLKKEEISVTLRNVLRGGIKYHHGDLSLKNPTLAEGLVLPEIINGNLDLNNLTSAKGLKLPKTITGDINLRSLTSVEGLVLPEIVNGDLNLGNLVSAKGLKLPEIVNGNLDLNNLQLTEGLILPRTIGGTLNLSSLTSVKGLILPKTINGSIGLGGLISAEGLILPKTISGYISLSSLTSAEGLKLPETVNGGINLRSLKSAKGLKFPKTVNGDLDLYNLISAEGLKLPETVNGDLYLHSLTSVKDFVLPKNMTGRYYGPPLE